MDYFITYLLLKLDAIQGFMFAITVISISSMYVVWATNSYMKKKPIFITFIISGFLTTLIPDTKQAMLIYTIPKVKQGAETIIKNKKVQAIPDKLLTIANKQLDEWINNASNKEANEVERIKTK